MNVKLCHISIDDFVKALQELSNPSYNSLWQQPIFRYLYILNKIFGAKFTLNIFEKNRNWNISNVTDRFKREFANASSWLKFAYHSKDETNPIEREVDTERFRESFARVNLDIVRFASKDSIARVYIRILIKKLFKKKILQFVT